MSFAKRQITAYSETSESSVLDQYILIVCMNQTYQASVYILCEEREQNYTSDLFY